MPMSEDRRDDSTQSGRPADDATKIAPSVTGEAQTVAAPRAGGEAATIAATGAGGGETPAQRVVPRAGPRVFRERYEVISVLGRGGFGAVYKVRDRNFNTPVYRALKTLKTDDDAAIDDVFLRSFESEANTQVNLNHPGIVRVYDYNPDPREPFIVMELVDSGSLLDHLRRHGKLSWTEAADIGIQVADALDYAHSKGLHAHRDVKPGNIFCPEPGRYQIGDFGIARSTRPGQTHATQFSIGAIGTEGYMPPEQILPPRAVDAKTDEFALAVVLYEAITGKLPYRTASLNFDPDEDPESARRIVDVSYTRPPSFAQFEHVPAEGVEAIKRALSPSPADRYPDCRTFAEALRAARNAPVVAPVADTAAPAATTPGSRVGLAVAAVALLVLAAVAFWLWPRPPAESVARRGAETLAAARYAPRAWADAEQATAAGDATRAETLYEQAATAAWTARQQAATALRTRAEGLGGAATDAFRTAAEAETAAAAALRTDAARAVTLIDQATADYARAVDAAVKRARDEAGARIQALRARIPTDVPAAGRAGVDQLAQRIDATLARTDFAAEQRREVEDGLNQLDKMIAALPRAAPVPPAVAPPAAPVPPPVPVDPATAFAAARAARDAALGKSATSPALIKARAAQDRGEKLLADAGAALEREPQRAAALAGQAEDKFKEALSQATKEYARLKGDAESQRSQALRARAAADAAGVAANDRAQDLYAQGERSLADAADVEGDTPEAVKSRLDQYASARKRFGEAAALVRPVEPTPAPAVAARPPLPTVAAPPRAVPPPAAPAPAAPAAVSDVDGMARGWIDGFCAEQDRKMKAQYAGRAGVGVRCANKVVGSGAAGDVPVSFEVIVTAPDQSLTNEVRDSPPKEMRLRLDCSGGQCKRKG